MASLSRLGVDSGGTLTQRTNDSALAWNAVMRRMACTYTLAFKDDGPHDGRRRQVAVTIRRPNLHAVHAAAYTLRSDAAKRDSLMDAAYSAPLFFQTGSVRASLTPVAPRSSTQWTARLDITFPLPARPSTDPDHDAPITLEAVLSRGTTIEHELSRILDPPPTAMPTAPSTRTVTEQLDVKPGTYTLSAVLFDPAAGLPQTVQVEVVVPEVVKGR